LPLEPPTGTSHWHPDRDPEPRNVGVVVRYGQPPELRQAVRVDVDKWIETGALVGYYADRTPPMPWREVGVCWVGTRHPVVGPSPGSWDSASSH
jgi:hypothetical protein